MRDQTAAKPKQSESELAKVEGQAKPLLDFWNKVNNDWVFNLSGMLAYNFLMSIFPILLVILAIVGLALGGLSPDTLAAFHAAVNKSLPGGSNIIGAVTTQLRNSAGILLVVGVLSAAFAGSRLFVVIENCFGVIFRLRGRDPLRQNLMAFGMLLLYIVLIPLISLGSVIPSAILSVVSSLGHNPVMALLIQVLGILVSVVIAALFFAAIYIVVPNRPVHIREVWKGTLVAAALLAIYNLVFPLYESYFLHPKNYGSVAGFAVVILVFFYYLAFIMLIGAEVNSWAAGQRQTMGDITAMMHEVQAHDTTRGIAGPTAGLPQEDLQHSKGAVAMRDTPSAIEHERVDHNTDIQPPKPAEAHAPGLPYRDEQQRHERYEQAEGELHGAEATGPSAGGTQTRGQDAQGTTSADAATAASPSTRRAGRAAGSGSTSGSQVRPMSAPQRRTLVAVLAAVGVVMLPLVRWLFNMDGSSGGPTATP
jgi:membrane protein